MKSPMYAITGLLLLMSLLLSPVQAEAAGLFKWTDKDGVVHFSDQPHDVPKAERIMMPRASAPGAPPPEKAESADTEGGEDALARHQREVRAANCDIARRTLEHNETIQRMYRLDENGERVFLTDEERANLLKRSHDDVAQWCA